MDQVWTYFWNFSREAIMITYATFNGKQDLRMLSNLNYVLCGQVYNPFFIVSLVTSGHRSGTWKWKNLSLIAKVNKTASCSHHSIIKEISVSSYDEQRERWRQEVTQSIILQLLVNSKWNQMNAVKISCPPLLTSWGRRQLNWSNNARKCDFAFMDSISHRSQLKSKKTMDSINKNNGR